MTIDKSGKKNLAVRVRELEMELEKRPNPKTATTSQVLDFLSEFLFRNDAQSQKVWDVLTALRGPDIDNFDVQELKGKTTSVIRYILYSRTQDMTHYSSRFVNDALVLSDTAAKKEFREKELRRLDDSRIFSHFMSHVRRAFDVLIPPAEGEEQ